MQKKLLPGMLRPMHKENITYIITSENRLYSICNLVSCQNSQARILPLPDELYTHTSISSQASSVFSFNVHMLCIIKIPFVSLQKLVFLNLILCCTFI